MFDALRIEYDEDKFRAMLRADGRSEGEFEILESLLDKGRLSEEDAAEEVGMSVDEFRSHMKWRKRVKASR